MKDWANDTYDLYNRFYFRGKLPKILVKFVVMPKKKRSGSTVFLDGRPSVIFLDTYLKHRNRLGKIVLLHEMTHVSLPMKEAHGAKHDRALDRLVRLGAYKGLL